MHLGFGIRFVLWSMDQLLIVCSDVAVVLNVRKLAVDWEGEFITSVITTILNGIILEKLCIGRQREVGHFARRSICDILIKGYELRKKQNVHDWIVPNKISDVHLENRVNFIFVP